MSRHNPSQKFVALNPPKVAWDLEMQRPVLVLGHWHDDQDRAFKAEVITMSSNRPLYRLAEIPSAKPLLRAQTEP